MTMACLLGKAMVKIQRGEASRWRLITSSSITNILKHLKKLKKIRFFSLRHYAGSPVKTQTKLLKASKFEARERLGDTGSRLERGMEIVSRERFGDTGSRLERGLERP